MSIIKISETFDGHAVEVVQLGGDRYVSGPQIGTALGFGDPVRAISKLYSRSQSEFEEGMSIVLEMPTAGGRQLVRLYNARGAALIAMKAQTPKGEDFRRWVLDVLEGRDDTTPVEAATDIPANVRTNLAAMFMQRRGNPQLLRYRDMGLGVAEIARLLGVKPASINPRLRVAEYLGLAAAPSNLKALRQKPSFIKLTEGRDRAFTRRQQLTIAAPDGESGNG